MQITCHFSYLESGASVKSKVGVFNLIDYMVQSNHAVGQINSLGFLSLACESPSM